MSENTCAACRRPKATIQCEACEDWNCKSCAELLDETAFSFLAKVPEELKHSRYCQHCWQMHVEPALEDYQQKMQAAKDVFIFFTTQKKPIPVLSKEKDQIRVENCEDRDETILRLAFKAVEAGCNAVVETNVISEKVRNAGWQKTAWKGSGFAATVDGEKIERSWH
jgi:hypothetical protein